MSVTKFMVWETHWQTDRRHKVSLQSWPSPFEEAADDATEFARVYTERWRDDPDFPDHPCRDKDGHIVLPASLDTPPVEYLEANAPPGPPPEPAVRYPFSGPANILRTASTDPRTIAAYELSRRNLKPLVAQPAPAPYEAPTSPASSHTPSFTGSPAPDIAPRYYSRDKHDPKFRRPGAA